MSVRNAVILEDDDVHAAAIRQSLEKFGIQVHVAKSPEDVVQQFASAELFIIDIELGVVKNGLAIIGDLRERLPNAFAIVYSQFADQPQYRFLAQDKQPDMLMTKRHWDEDALAMLTGYTLKRLESLESEQAALIFLSARLGLYTVLWAAGTLVLMFGVFTLGVLPWLNLFGWLVIWTFASVVPWTWWIARSGIKIERIGKSHLFRSYLGAKKWLAALIGALAVALFVEFLKNQGLRR
jgi:CheY-like chemotaxis protein